MVKSVKTVKIIKPTKKVIEIVKKIEAEKIIEKKESPKLYTASSNSLKVIAFLIYVAVNICILNGGG